MGLGRGNAELLQQGLEILLHRLDLSFMMPPLSRGVELSPERSTILLSGSFLLIFPCVFSE
jgi:hypothetical protein